MNASEIQARRLTRIEWLIETLDGPDTDDADADIIDVDHADTYREALARIAGLGGHYRLGLVRDRETRDGDIDRSWAYIENGQLADWFTDANGRRTIYVPKRYRSQFNCAQPVSA